MTKTEIKALREISEYGNDGAYVTHFPAKVINVLRQCQLIKDKSLTPPATMDITKVELTDLGNQILKQVSTDGETKTA